MQNCGLVILHFAFLILHCEKEESLYLVISYWELLPGHEAEADRVVPVVHGLLRRQPGVLLAEAFRCDGKFITVHGYENETMYQRVLDNPNSGFNQALLDFRIQEKTRWLHSER